MKLKICNKQHEHFQISYTDDTIKTKAAIKHCLEDTGINRSNLATRKKNQNQKFTLGKLALKETESFFHT